MKKIMIIAFTFLSLKLHAEELKMPCETIYLYGKMIMSFKQDNVSKVEIERLMSNTIKIGPREIIENKNNLNYTEEMISAMIEEAFKQPILKPKHKNQDQLEDFSSAYEDACIAKMLMK